MQLLMGIVIGMVLSAVRVFAQGGGTYEDFSTFNERHYFPGTSGGGVVYDYPETDQRIYMPSGVDEQDGEEFGFGDSGVWFGQRSPC